MPIHGYLGGVISATAPSVTTAGASGVFTLEEQLQASAQNNWPGYQISRSVRLRSSASAYFNRTPASASNQKTWTWSGWVKRGQTTDSALFGIGTSGSNYFNIRFQPDYLSVVSETPSITIELRTTPVYRDYSAWYHIVFALDTTQATSSDRAKLYVNGVQVTAFSTATYPSQNANLLVNSATSHYLGLTGQSTAYFDGYLTEINFIDGQALTPASFGVTDSVTGVWNPIRYSGTYGNNGFYLNFSDNSAATATTIGKDYSGNGNNWTPNNISVTAGTTYDSMVDVPIGYGSDTGVGGELRGNYCTFNPLFTGGTLASGNLDFSASAAVRTSLSTIAVPTSGKWYWEVTVTAVGNSFQVGIGGALSSGTNYLGSSSDAYSYSSNALKYNNNSSTSYGATYTTNDVIAVAYDADAGTLVFYKNNTSQGTAFSSLSGTFFPAVSYGSSSGSGSCTINFGQRAFSYTAPSGYKALCTQNLPTATIDNGANYVAASLYTGTGSSQTVSNVVNSISFQPDMVWIKSRSAATDHKLTDSVRGATKAWVSNSTAAETTDSTGLTAFGSSGFTVGASTTYNNSGATYVGWGWKGGGTAVTNTSGTVNSSVSANTTAGFSAVTYTGSASAVTVGHGLGVAPSMVIVKALGTPNGTARPSLVYHISIGATKILYLDRTDAATTTSGPWNDTAPTSTVFSLGTEPSTNWASNNYVAYCFAPITGYSAFGSYTGNGSTDGPFIFTNMRPRWLMFKRTDSTNNWIMYDTSRSTYNAAQNFLYPDLANTEGTGVYIDFVSNGFKLRDTNAIFNASGGTYIYAAFAENPFNISRAR